MPWWAKKGRVVRAVVSCPPCWPAVPVKSPPNFPTSAPEAQRPPVWSKNCETWAGARPYRVGKPKLSRRPNVSAPACDSDRRIGGKRGRNAQESVELSELSRGDDGKVSEGGSVELASDLLRESLLDLEVLNLGTGRLDTLDDGLGKGLDVTVGGVCSGGTGEGGSARSELTGRGNGKERRLKDVQVMTAILAGMVRKDLRSR